ncbi:DUF4148 domain-containing protein [Noviherbaspirillum sp. ST9]|uniref:DUF4148 domain-containing protein n=1 Tax=Noviherbaspirillum sp. ST9 TaxID=3401606 RepID=UPI003B5899EE
MKTTRCISRITALSVLAVSGIAVADVGMSDGSDFFRDFKSTKSRAEVRAELDAARGQSSLNSDRISADSYDSASGVRGMPGSRYTGKTRQEVRDELIQYRKTHDSSSPSDLYFGG